jgi:PadR family transcriptional regulator PadR
MVREVAKFLKLPLEDALMMRDYVERLYLKEILEKEDAMNIQFKKGVLELCVLSMLYKKDCYGYELVNQISKKILIAEGTIYPLLKRLKDEGFFITYLKESQEGPPRKYYKLTELGIKTKEELEQEWDNFVQGVSEIMKEGNEREQE